MRRAVALAVVLVTAAILPGRAAASSQSVADFWSGSWPSFLMENGQVTDALGTLNWRQVRNEEGAALVGHLFGGKPFEGCPVGEDVLYFRGKYVTGGDLVACTTNGDGKTIVGRFNGNEQVASGSFEISIVEDGDKRVFAGIYLEDSGLVTDWCGSLVPGSQPSTFEPRRVDFVSPAVAALRSVGRAGSVVRLRFRVSEPATVRLLVRRAGRTIAAIRTRAAAGAATASWRTPTRLRGVRLTFTVVAVDPAGNVSAASAAALRLT